MQTVTVAAAHEQLGIEPTLDHVGRSPFTGDERVVAEMPPEVVVELLVAALYLPAAERLEGLVVEHEDPAGGVAVDVAERTNIDAVRPAMHGVRAAVAGALGDHLRLNGLDDLRTQRI